MIFLQHAKLSKKINVWILIPKLRLELYNAEFLGKIGVVKTKINPSINQ